ncbi:hypothetical protein ACPCK3_07360 [Streptomyces griseoincarnatus]
MAERTGAAAAGTGSYREGPAGVAYKALLEHTRECRQCVENVGECGTGRALVRTLKDAARQR